MEAERGIPARHQRYVENNRLLIEKMKELGIRPYIDEEHQGPIITTFFYPENASFSFADMYQYIKERGRHFPDRKHRRNLQRRHPESFRTYQRVSGTEQIKISEEKQNEYI